MSKPLTELLDRDKNREFWDEANSDLAHIIPIGLEKHEELMEPYAEFDNEELASILADFPFSFVMLLKKHNFDVELIESKYTSQ